MNGDLVTVIGAGPYGLSAVPYLPARGTIFEVYGIDSKTMGLWASYARKAHP